MMTTTKRAIKAGSFPKRCACGRTWTEKEWRTIPHYGIQDGTLDGVRFAADLDLRNCVCRSTMAVPMESL